MKNVVIDTCVIIHIVRATTTGQKCLTILEAIEPEPNIIISVVTKAELESFSEQNQWGKAKKAKLNAFVSSATVIDIKAIDNQLTAKYVQIDGYSKGKLVDNNGNIKAGSSIKMGKNDLWIATTAYAINATLVTTDGDFDHLNGKLIKVVKVV